MFLVRGDQLIMWLKCDELLGWLLIQKQCISLGALVLNPRWVTLLLIRSSPNSFVVQNIANAKTTAGAKERSTINESKVSLRPIRRFKFTKTVLLLLLFESLNGCSSSIRNGSVLVVVLAGVRCGYVGLGSFSICLRQSRIEFYHPFQVTNRLSPASWGFLTVLTLVYLFYNNCLNSRTLIGEFFHQ